MAKKFARTHTHRHTHTHTHTHTHIHTHTQSHTDTQTCVSATMNQEIFPILEASRPILQATLP